MLMQVRNSKTQMAIVIWIDIVRGRPGPLVTMSIQITIALSVFNCQLQPTTKYSISSFLRTLFHILDTLECYALV